MGSRGTVVLSIDGLANIYFPIGSDAGTLTAKRLKKVQKWVSDKTFDWANGNLPKIREEVIRDMVRVHVLSQEEADAGTETHPYKEGLTDVFNEYEYHLTLRVPVRRDQDWRLDVQEVKEAYYREKYTREHNGQPVPVGYFG
jgi:hypothetical protein